MASLCLLNEDGATTQRWELGERPLAVGRDNSSDIIVEDQTLSRRHFVIIRKAGEYLLNDLESQNGTFVDGHRVSVEPAKLRHDVCIAAGRTLFVFSQKNAAPSAAAA